MKIRGMSTIFVLSIMFVLSSCQLVPKQDALENSVGDTSEILVVETSMTEQTTEIVQTEVSDNVTEIEISETEFVTSLPNMRYIEFDGSILPDGIYYIEECIYDDDRLGVTCSVYGFPYLLEDDIKLLNEGDKIKYNDDEYTVSSLHLENTKHPVSLNDFGLEKQFNDQYFIEDGCDGRVTGTALVESYHLGISSNIAIWQGSIFGISKEEHDSWYINNGYFDQLQSWGLDSTNDFIFFKNIDKLIEAWDQECEYRRLYCESNNIEYVAPLYGYYPGGLVVVKDQVISEMYINPWQHQPMFLYTYLWKTENDGQ